MLLKFDPRRDNTELRQIQIAPARVTAGSETHLIQMDKSCPYWRIVKNDGSICNYPIRLFARVDCEWERVEREMEGVGALGVSSSPTLVGKISCSRRLSYSSNKLTLRTTSHLAAFHPQSHLFVKFPPCPQRKTVARNSNETGIFLPHLVASMVCFSISLFLIFCTILIGTRIFSYLIFNFFFC